MFFGSRAEVVLWTIFCFLTVSSIYWNQGLDFAKFFTPWSCLLCVLWLQSRSCFTAIFVTRLCRAFVRTRCLISLNFSYPGLVYYLQQSCPSDYIKHIHHAFIIIFETRNTGCCYGHAPRLAHSPPHATSFGWFVFLSSHLIPAHGMSGLYPSSGRGHQISPSLSIEAWARLV